MTIDRRSFLLGSGALALLAGSAGLAAPAEAQAAAAAFPIGGKDKQLFKPKALDYRSGFQSFAWSPVLKAFVYAQPAPASGHSGTLGSKHYGDLLVSTITAGGTTSKSHMQLNGFGHGGAMGVEISGSHTYLWLDCDAHVPKDKDDDADARAICCFRYTGKGTYTSKSVLKTPHAQHYVLKPGSTHNAVTYDPTTRRIALRYRTGSTDRYAVYDVAALRRTGNRTKPLYDAIAAGTVEAGGTGSRQSFALHGDWLYAIRGSKSKNNATLHAYNLKTRRATHAALHAAAGAKGREPEGLCVYPVGSTPRLAFGIKTDVTSPNQRSSIYYKY